MPPRQKIDRIKDEVSTGSGSDRVPIYATVEMARS